MSNKTSNLFFTYESISSETVHSTWIKNQSFLNKKILDIGCGSGRDAGYIAGKGAFSVTAIDSSRDIIRLAKEKHKSSKIKWFVDNLPKLSTIHNENLKAFDFILCSAVLMLLNREDQIKSIIKIFDLLSPGGKAVISVKKDINDERIFDVNESIFNVLKEESFDLFITNGGSDSLGRNQISWKIYTLIKK